MSERAEKRLPVTEATKNLIDEARPDGCSYDLWVRYATKNAPPMDEERPRA